MNAYALRYLKTGLTATPLVLERLVVGITAGELDRRPDPERFTIREVVAHLADWEPIWHERIHRIATEDTPTLPGYDEGQWAIDHDYAHSHPAEQLGNFRTGREALSLLLEGLPEDAWQRVGIRDELGPLTIHEIVAMVLGHDGYHAKQIIEYRQAH